MFGLGKKRKEALAEIGKNFREKSSKQIEEFEMKVATADLNADLRVVKPEAFEEPKEEEKPEEEWIWVDGYKAIYADMKPKHGDITYAVGETFSLEEGKEVEACRTGFHFCLKPEHIRHYYSYGRLFKVRAEVLKSEYEKFGADGTYKVYRKEYHPMLGYMPDHAEVDKMAARSITFVEEITDWDLIKKTFPAKHPFVNTIDEWWEYIEFCGSKNRDGDPHRDWARLRFCKIMRGAGFA